MPSPLSKPIRLLHIPKTAGTTVASGLLRVLGRRNRFIFSTDHRENLERISKMSQKELDAIRVFIGHSLFETGIPVADNAALVTYIREPVSRVKSFISHVAAGKSRYLSDSDQGRNTFSIDDFLESGNLELENLQTKIFVNRDRLESESGIKTLGPEAALKLATDRLFHDVTAFGLQDRFDEGWVAIWHGLGIKPPLYAMMNRRPSDNRLDFTPEQIERIKDLNQLDIRLYEAACREFDRRMMDGMILQHDLHKFIERQQRGGRSFSMLWNGIRKLYYAGRRTKRRFLG